MNKSKVFESASDSSVNESEEDNNQVNCRYNAGEGYHAVPPPYTGNYMPPKDDLSFVGLDDSVFKSKVGETITSVSKNETNASKTSKDSLEKPKTVRFSAPIIEDWESYSENENVFESKEVKKTVKPSLEKIEFVNARNTTVKKKTKLKNLGRKYVFKNKSNATSQRKVRPVWNNAQRVNHQNFSNNLTHPHPKRNFIPTVVATKSGQVPVNTTKQSSPRAATSISTARLVNTVVHKPKMNDALPTNYSYFKAHSYIKRLINKRTAVTDINFNKKVSTAKKIPLSMLHSFNNFGKLLLQTPLDTGEVQITAIIDGKVKLVSEASIRRHLKLEDSDGINTLPNTKIFEQLALMSNIATAIICLATNRTFNFSKMIFERIVKNLDIPIESHHTPFGAPTTSQPPLLSPSRIPTGQETEVPRPSSLTHTNFVDEVASIGVDVRHGGAATTVSSLDIGQGSDRVLALQTDLQQTKKVYSIAFTKLIMKEIEFETKDISIAETLMYIRRSASKYKGKGIMTESEPEQTTTKLQQRQEKAGYEAAVRLQEQLDEEERQRIARVHKEASSFNVAKWEDIQATIEADEEAQQRTYMSNYVKHMGSHTLQQLKRLSFDELKNLFEATVKRVKTFTLMESDVDRTIPKIVDKRSKRAAEEELEQESSKRVRNHTETYQIFADILKKFNKDGLIKLWDLVKERFSTTKPTNDKEKELRVELKRLFEPDNDGSFKCIYMILWYEDFMIHVVYTMDLHTDGLIQRNLMNNKMNIKFRGGLLGVRGFYNLMLLVQVSTVGYKSFCCWLKKLLLMKIRENGTKF
nr:hypothetical protein [Tanacetum cinerariifolium]